MHRSKVVLLLVQAETQLNLTSRGWELPNIMATSPVVAICRIRSITECTTRTH